MDRFNFACHNIAVLHPLSRINQCSPAGSHLPCNEWGIWWGFLSIPAVQQAVVLFYPLPRASVPISEDACTAFGHGRTWPQLHASCLSGQLRSQSKQLPAPHHLALAVILQGMSSNVCDWFWGWHTEMKLILPPPVAKPKGSSSGLWNAAQSCDRAYTGCPIELNEGHSAPGLKLRQKYCCLASSQHWELKIFLSSFAVTSLTFISSASTECRAHMEAVIIKKWILAP